MICVTEGSPYCCPFTVNIGVPLTKFTADTVPETVDAGIAVPSDAVEAATEIETVFPISDAAWVVFSIAIKASMFWLSEESDEVSAVLFVFMLVSWSSELNCDISAIISVSLVGSVGS